MHVYQNLEALVRLGVLLYLILWTKCLCSAKPILSSLSSSTIDNINLTPDYHQYENFISATSQNDDSITTTESNNNDNEKDKSLIVEFRSMHHQHHHNHHHHQSFESEKKDKSSSPPKRQKLLLNNFQSSRQNNIAINKNTQKVLSRTDRNVDLVILNNSLSGVKRVKNNSRASSSILERNERSTNLSHIAGSTRRIQLYIKNRFLQILSDGTVNGTTDDTSEFTIIQRTTVNVGQIKMQSVATCLFLCMDACGQTYGSVEFNDDCVFNEAIEQHHYNTYSSTFHSNEKRKLYLGLNRHGQMRKIILPSSRQLGKLSTYTNSLTHTISHDRVQKVLERVFGPNYGRHSLKQLCESGKQREASQENMKKPPKCDPNAKLKIAAKKRKNNQKCTVTVTVTENESQSQSDPNNTQTMTTTNNFKHEQSIKINKRKNQSQRRCQPDNSNNSNSNVKIDNNNHNSNVSNNNNNNKNKKKMKNVTQNPKLKKNNHHSNNEKEKRQPLTVEQRKKEKINNKGSKSERKKKKTTTQIPPHLQPSVDEQKPNNENDEENFTSDEIDSFEESDYDEFSFSKGKTSNFISDYHDAYDYNS